jgi:hypothetical protein
MRKGIADSGSKGAPSLARLFDLGRRANDQFIDQSTLARAWSQHPTHALHVFALALASGYDDAYLSVRHIESFVQHLRRRQGAQFAFLE